MKNILIAHHEPYLAAGLCVELAKTDRRLCVKPVSDAKNFQSLVKRKRAWSVVLASLEIGAPNVIQFFESLRTLRPSLPFLFIGEPDRLQLGLEEITSLGAGFVSSLTPSKELIRLLKLAVAGQPAFTPCGLERARLCSDRTREVAKLSPDEMRLVRLLGQNFGDDEIGRALGLSASGARKRISRLMKKVGKESPGDLRFCAFKFRYGILDEYQICPSIRANLPLESIKIATEKGQK